MSPRTQTYSIAGVGVVLALLIALFTAGCTGTQGPATPTPTTTPVTTTTADQVVTVSPTTGTPAASATSSSVPVKTPVKLKISGSTSVLPIIQKAAESFMAKHENYDIQVSAGGSGAGITAIGAKTVDVGMSSRDLKAEEKQKYPGLIQHYIADDGIAVIVNPANKNQVMTLSAIKDIFSGATRKWQTAGATMNPDDIVCVGRESTSGTREYFYEFVMGKTNFIPTLLEKNSNGAVAQTVAQTPGAIGYVSLGYLGTDKKIVPLAIQNNATIVAPSVASVQDRSYPIWRQLYLFTNGLPSPAAKEFIDYLLSPDGQKDVLDAGGVPLKL
jgi:phosphate transport system substrate-binding protein